MSPVETLKALLKLDPAAARLIYVGIAVLGAAVIVLGWLNNPADALPVAIWVIGFGMAVPLLMYMIKERTMRMTLCWMLIAMIVAFQVYVVAAVFPQSAIRKFTGPVTPLSCGVRLIFDLDECVRTFTRPIEGTAAYHPARPADEDRIWLAQNTTVPAHSRVFLQFGPGVDRTTTIGIAQTLVTAGWGVEGADLGGEAVKAAPDGNEVRFFHAGDEEAARALAQSLAPLTGNTSVTIRDFSRLYGLVPPGQLEIWLVEARPPGIDG
jgi:hypothetical protein